MGLKQVSSRTAEHAALRRFVAGVDETTDRTNPGLGLCSHRFSRHFEFESKMLHPYSADAPPILCNNRRNFNKMPLLRFKL